MFLVRFSFIIEFQEKVPAFARTNKKSPRRRFFWYNKRRYKKISKEKTMKTIFLIITLVFLFSLGTGVLAQETELPDPGLTPDSPFYFLETIAEGIGTFFTFGDIKKAERHATLAAERLAEAQAVIKKGKSELVEKTLKRYEMQFNKSIARAEKARAKGKDTEKIMEIVARIGRATSKHLEVLAEVYEKVPEQAKPAIENAMKVSVKGHEKAVEVLKENNALGKVPETVSLPPKIPAEVRERIQTKVQQELEIDKILEGLDSSKSLRTFCIEQGEPSEMCEKIPLQGFKSFKALGAFCTEVEGPSEICESIEATCKGLEITTPDECFLVLSTGKVEMVPVSERATEERRAQVGTRQDFGVFKTKCLEAGGPPEMCTSLVNNLQSSGSLRTFCIEQGGPSEMCETIPRQGFESFGQIEGSRSNSTRRVLSYSFNCYSNDFRCTYLTRRRCSYKQLSSDFLSAVSWTVS